MKNNFYPFINLPLPYEFNAMEPFIDEKTMCLHHDRHLKTYIDNLNAVLEQKPQLQKFSLEQLIKISAGHNDKLSVSVCRNAGGVYNHRFFFDGLKNPSENFPLCPLTVAIANQFGGFDNFKNEFKAAALSVFGSGYAWLVSDKRQLKIITTKNQDCPISQKLKPILTIDVWEHAYYLKHYNKRADYIDDWFNIINWENANIIYLCTGS